MRFGVKSAMRRILRTLSALLLGLWFIGAAWAQTLQAATLLGKPLASVEASLGKPRHVEAKTGTRFYKVEGFVRVVATLSPQKTLASLTFQLERGTIPDEREALAKVGVETLPTGWASTWSMPGDSDNDELKLFKPAPSNPNKFIATKHFLERMQERGVSQAEALDLLQNGQRFYDPKNDSYIRYKNGVYVALTRDGILKTVVRGNVNRHWRPL